jgi:UDP-glucuronate 4-epimerase
MTTTNRILVTGAAGFIGSTLVDRLLAEGREVVGLDSFDPFYSKERKLRNLEEARTSPRFRLERIDVRDADAIGTLFSRERFDAVAHLAALAGVRPSLERPLAYFDVNVNGTAVLLDAAARHQIPRFVLASSSSVYGERKGGPFRETDRVERPISPYAASKRAAELIAHTFHHTKGLPIACVRIFTAYGPRQRPDLAICKFATRMRRGEKVPIYGDGSAVRDFTYIDDLVDGLVRTLDAELGFAILNLGAGRAVSVLDVVRTLEKELGLSAEIEWLPRLTGDVSRTWADITAARQALGYAPETPLSEGIRCFVSWLAEEW